ncbi:MAG: hypothetical protein ACJAZC_001235 [Cryomorphaceae bacterium]|jgi:hypothetical protein
MRGWIWKAWSMSVALATPLMLAVKGKRVSEKAQVRSISHANKEIY